MKYCFILLLFIVQLTFAQSNQEKAFEKGRAAIQLMDNGQVEEAVKLLEEAQKLDPERFDYPYEMAYARYIQQDFKGAIKILEKIESHRDVSDRLYQLLGNSYDNIGNTDKAMGVYERGLMKFPHSGSLYHEQGIVKMNRQEYDEALSFFEKGIYMSPAFPSNYYRAAKIYCSSTEEVWGMIYGEIFINLERNSQRTVEISKLLYDTYKGQILFTSDTSMSVGFSQQTTMNVSNSAGKKEFKLPYGMVYELTLMMSIENEKTIDLNSLDRIRKRFVFNYFNQEFGRKYNNALFEYQKQIADAGHLEAYNYWVLMKGNENEFATWVVLNKEKWDRFTEWFTAHPIKINDKNRFFSGQY